MINKKKISFFFFLILCWLLQGLCASHSRGRWPSVLRDYSGGAASDFEFYQGFNAQNSSSSSSEDELKCEQKCFLQERQRVNQEDAPLPATQEEASKAKKEERQRVTQKDAPNDKKEEESPKVNQEEEPKAKQEEQAPVGPE